jgi:leader peptidase (prepilin peptidase)/N-methyltransferase
VPETLSHFVAQAAPIWVLQHVPVAVFVFAFGACVGSFINVVNYRLPKGMSVTVPPSRCPTCGARLKFFSENLPILGWFLVRGRCRYCKAPVSPEYMFIELLMALLFLGLYVLLYVVHPSTPWWGEIGGPWWFYNGPFRTGPLFIALAFLVAGLVSMTMIDARTFTIPIEVPLFITITALIAHPLQGLVPLRAPSAQTYAIPGVGWLGLLVGAGGMAGVLVSLALLKAGKLRHSFADYHDHVPEDQVLGDYPHARREMFVELKFLTPCLLGMVLGGVAWKVLGPETVPPAWAQAFGGACMGYLVGGGMIWGIRILGTLGFGREAMGLGDVHLLAAVGAVLGWFDPAVVFFLAPFSGIIWAVVSMGIASVFRRAKRELPYGPHLAVATVLVVLCRPAVHWAWAVIVPGVPMPMPGFVP